MFLRCNGAIVYQRHTNDAIIDSVFSIKGKNIDGMIVGWRNKPFPQWWVLNPLGRTGRFGLWGRVARKFRA